MIETAVVCLLGACFTVCGFGLGARWASRKVNDATLAAFLEGRNQGIRESKPKRDARGWFTK